MGVMIVSFCMYYEFHNDMFQLTKHLTKEFVETSFKNKERVKLMISFDSCGWLYMYHFGV